MYTSVLNVLCFVYVCIREKKRGRIYVMRFSQKYISPEGTRKRDERAHGVYVFWIRDTNIRLYKCERDVHFLREVLPLSALHARCFLFVSNKNADRTSITKQRHEVELPPRRAASHPSDEATKKKNHRFYFAAWENPKWLRRGNRNPGVKQRRNVQQ